MNSADTVHILVKWNPGPSFERETIAAHVEVLSRHRDHVWWGKISKTRRLGITRKDLQVIKQQLDDGRETRLYAYCPDKKNLTLHVAHVAGVQSKWPNDPERIPRYYSRTTFPIAYWFKITDIRQLSTEHLSYLTLRTGQLFDPVASNAFPLIVKDLGPKKLFDYRLTRGIKYWRYQRLDLPEHATAHDINPRLVFVLMPFDKKFIDVWELGIRPSIDSLKLDCRRADDFAHNKEILAVIRTLIQQSLLIIADITDNNANVFYELGFAHGLGKPAILITQNRDEVPFDLRGIKNIEYRSVTDLKSKLPELVSTVLNLSRRKH